MLSISDNCRSRVAGQIVVRNNLITMKSRSQRQNSIIYLSSESTIMNEERRMSSPNGSSRGKTDAFEFNSEIPRVSIPRQFRGSVFRSNQPSSRSCKGPVSVVYRNTLIPVWFGYFWLATIWPTCLNQFLDNVRTD